jgi:site-specific recombinase XerD
MSKNEYHPWQGQSEKIKYLDETELRALFSVIKDKMHKALFKLMYRCGLRLTEAINLKVSDLDLDHKKVKVTRAKRKDNFREHMLPLDDEDVEILRRWLKAGEKHGATKAGSPYLFLSQMNKGREGHIGAWQVQYLFRNYCEEAGRSAEKAHPHALRHSAGIMLAKKGMNVEAIRDWLGHANVISTEIYVRLAGKERQEVEEKALEAFKL